VHSSDDLAARNETEIADQFGDPARGGVKDNLAGLADLEQLAAVDHGQAVGEGLGVG